MQTKEKKICSFQQNGSRLQLIEITYSYTMNEYAKNGNKWTIKKYQVRLNRKVIDTSISEYQMRKLFATYCQNIVLQLKIY